MKAEVQLSTMRSISSADDIEVTFRNGSVLVGRFWQTHYRRPRWSTQYQKELDPVTRLFRPLSLEGVDAFESGVIPHDDIVAIRVHVDAPVAPPPVDHASTATTSTDTSSDDEVEDSSSETTSDATASEDSSVELNRMLDNHRLAERMRRENMTPEQVAQVREQNRERHAEVRDENRRNSTQFNYLQEFWEGRLEVEHLQNEFRVKWKTCRHCAAPILDGEESLCCKDGDRMLPRDSCPVFTQDYIDCIAKHKGVLATQSGFINSFVSFARPYTEKSNGLSFPFRAPDVGNLLLDGRMYAGWDGGSIPLFSTVNPVRDARPENNFDTPERRAAVEDFRAYLTAHHPLAHHIIQSRQLFAGAAILLFDRDVSIGETAAVTSHPTAWFLLPHVGYRLNPVQRGDEATRRLTANEPYESVVFPLLFPSGRGGISVDKRVPNFGVKTLGDATITTVHEFVKYNLYQRFFDNFVYLPRLTEQYMLDSLCRAESIRFDQISCNRQVTDQWKKRVAKYRDLNAAATTGDATTLKKTGVNWQIPSSIPGTPGYMRRKIADGMAVVAALGDPTLFITVTMPLDCPEMMEFLDRLPPSCPRNPEMYPSASVRIFRQKLLALERLLRSGKLFGSKAVYIQRTCEFQIRGLIHAHLMVRLSGQQPDTAAAVDKLISGRLFMQEGCDKPMADECNCVVHQLHRIVKDRMQHDCAMSQKCRDKKTCARGFPMPVLKDTTMIEGRWFPFRDEIDTKTASYNPVLSLGLGCHVHCDVCTGPGAAAYIRKYIAKMPDQARVALQKPGTHDLREELRLWEKCRHVSSSEAAVRLLHMNVHLCEPAVTVLPVHQEGDNRVVFCVEDREQMEEKLIKYGTPLLRYFWRPPELEHLKYIEYHERFMVSKSEPKRAAYVRDNPVDLPEGTDVDPFYVYERSSIHVCRLARIPLSNDTREDYCLRQLALEFPARHWRDWLFGFDTFSAAAVAKGLFDADNEVRYGLQYLINEELRSSAWDEAHTQEQIVPRLCTAEELLRFWLIHLLSGSSHNPQQDFESFWPYLLRVIPNFTEVQKRFEALHIIQRALLPHRLSNSDVGLESVGDPDIVFVERNRYETSSLKATADKFSHLSPQQQQFIADIESQIESASPTKRTFFVKGDGGAGKTFMLNVLIARLRLRKHICLPVALTGNASQLYEGGDTAHRTFKLPVLPPDQIKDAESKLNVREARAKLLLHATLIVIDEVSMLSADHIRMIDEVLQKIFNNNLPFGGLFVIVSGDFKQLCPVNTSIHATKTSTVLFWHGWDRLFRANCVHLSSQFRSDDPLHTAFLTRVGFGVSGDKACPTCDGTGFLPPHRKCTTCIGLGIVEPILESDVFNCTIPPTIRVFDTTQLHEAITWLHRGDFASPAITANNVVIAFTHEVVTRHNTLLSQQAMCSMNATRSQQTLTAVNKPPTTRNAVHFAMGTPEILEKLEDKSLPPSKLHVFTGAIVSLLRNLNVKEGLANGTKCFVKCANRYLLRVVILGGKWDGEERVIPRIPFEATAMGTISFIRLQFPVKLSYSVTSNRSQGQTYTGRVLVDCSADSFSHGQVYVAASRSKRCDLLAFISPSPQHVRSVVWRDLLHRANEDPTDPARVATHTFNQLQPLANHFSDSDSDFDEEIQTNFEEEDMIHR